MQATEVDWTGTIDKQYVAAAAYADWLVSNDKMVQRIVDEAIKAKAILNPRRILSQNDFLKTIREPNFPLNARPTLTVIDDNANGLAVAALWAFPARLWANLAP
jgi:hypothetical protein